MQQPRPWVAALIGDLVASREAPDRLDLQRRVASVFDDIDGIVGGKPDFTIGDEFQARYPTVAAAVEASLQLHIRTIGVTGIRIGIGWGELIAEDPERTPFAQDGPCWWRAREAIETVDRSGRSRGPDLFTAIRTGAPVDPLLNHYLLFRDTLIQGFDEMDAQIAIGLLSGRSQTDMAGRLGINKSSVSRRAKAHGILALVEARDIGIPPVGP